MKASAWVLAFLGLAVGTVWLRLYIVRTSYEIDEVDREFRARTVEIERLRAELTRLKSPTQLRAAATKMGLNRPTAEQIIRVPEQ